MAKKILQQCLISLESPTVLAVRRKLFDWFSEKIKKKPDWKVFQCVPAANSNLARNIDCILQSSKKSFAYIIIDQSFQAGDLTVLVNEVHENEWALNVVFTKAWLKTLDGSSKKICLSDKERGFISRREYDLTVANTERILGSLFYFDAENDSMVFLRRIRSSSSSNHHCDKIECRLKDMLLLLKTGEFVAKGEPESLSKRKIRKEKYDKRMADKKVREEIRSRDDFWIDIATGKEIRRSEPVKNDDQRWGNCEICGDYTNYWWSFDEKNLTCKCKKCSGGGRNEES